MESLGTEARGEREAREEREAKERKEKREKKERQEKKGRRERKERKERRYWRRRKEGDIGDGRRKGASLLKSCTKRVKSSFLLRIMLKMLHFNANRN